MTLELVRVLVKAYQKCNEAASSIAYALDILGVKDGDSSLINSIKEEIFNAFCFSVSLNDMKSVYDYNIEESIHEYLEQNEPDKLYEIITKR